MIMAMQMIMSRFSRKDMLQQMVEEFYPILSPAGKTAHVHVPEDLVLPGDPDKLARVFNNILKSLVIKWIFQKYGRNFVHLSDTLCAVHVVLLLKFSLWVTALFPIA